MTRNEVVERLREHQVEIQQRFGVRLLGMFGSYARDEARPDSDVDLLVDFEGPITFLGYMGLIEHASRWLRSTSSNYG